MTRVYGEGRTHVVLPGNDTKVGSNTHTREPSHGAVRFSDGCLGGKMG